MFENAVLTYKGHLMAGVVYSPARLENTINLIQKSVGKKSATVIFHGDGEDVLNSIHGSSPRGSVTSLTDAECCECSTEVTMPLDEGVEVTLPLDESVQTELAFVAASTLCPQLVSRVVPCAPRRDRAEDMESYSSQSCSPRELEAQHETELELPEDFCPETSMSL